MNNHLTPNGNTNEHTTSEIETRINRTSPTILAVVLGVVLSGYFVMNRPEEETGWNQVSLNGPITVQQTDEGLFISYQGMSHRISDRKFEIEGYEVKVEGNRIFYRLADPSQSE